MSVKKKSNYIEDSKEWNEGQKRLLLGRVICAYSPSYSGDLREEDCLRPEFEIFLLVESWWHSKSFQLWAFHILYLWIKNVQPVLISDEMESYKIVNAKSFYNRQIRTLYDKRVTSPRRYKHYLSPTRPNEYIQDTLPNTIRVLPKCMCNILQDRIYVGPQNKP
jgi:hypothetical protein